MLPGEAPLDCKIARVAVPILSAMAEVLIGANTSLLLSAPDGTMLWRWAEDSRLSALLDRNSAVVGTRWSEDVVGTNGLGTSLETIQLITIHGAEHFSEALHPFTCAGAPIRHPITRRVAGTLSVTSLTKDSSPLMAATLKKLVREVEEQLYGDSTLRERELLHHFLTERRRGDSAVVVVNGDTVIANKAGVKLGIDHRSLWNQVEAGRPAELELDVPNRTEEISWRTIEHAGSVVGLVIVADRAGRTRRPDRFCTAATGKVRHRCRTGRSYPAGCGWRPPGAIAFWSPASPVSASAPSCRKRSASRSRCRSSTARRPRRSARSSGWRRRARCCPVPRKGPRLRCCCRIWSRCRSASPGPWGASSTTSRAPVGDLRLAATWTPTGTEPGPVLQSLLDRFASEPFEIPPLRKRPRDIQRGSSTRGRRCRCCPPPPRSWPSGIPGRGTTGSSRSSAAGWDARRGPILDVADLPPRWSRDAARSRLTTIQAAEADAINAELRANDGNKAAAAAALGISRSSLYRKMREYHLA